MGNPHNGFGKYQTRKLLCRLWGLTSGPPGCPVRTDNIISTNRQLKIFTRNSYKSFQEWTGVRNTFVKYVKIVHRMAWIKTGLKWIATEFIYISHKQHQGWAYVEYHEERTCHCYSVFMTYNKFNKKRKVLCPVGLTPPTRLVLGHTIISVDSEAPVPRRTPRICTCLLHDQPQATTFGHFAYLNDMNPFSPEFQSVQWKVDINTSTTG